MEGDRELLRRQLKLVWTACVQRRLPVNSTHTGKEHRLSTFMQPKNFVISYQFFVQGLFSLERSKNFQLQLRETDACSSPKSGATEH